MPKFKPGDLVRLTEYTHEDDLPKHRVAMVIEENETSKSYSKIYTIVFLGTEVRLRFHEMFLEPFTLP